MNISDLLQEKKKELFDNMNNSDPIVMAYTLGAYNLCDELLKYINQDIDTSKPSEKQKKYAICDSNYSPYYIVSGNEEKVYECIDFIHHCFGNDLFMATMHAAQRLFSELEWKFLLGCEFNAKNEGVDFVIVRNVGGFPVDEELAT